MKYFFRRRIPPLDRLLLVESGDRQIYENLLPHFYEYSPDIDLVTCFAGAPSSFRPASGRVYRVSDYGGAEGRARLVRELRSRSYGGIVILCTGLPVMTKWKWMLAARVPAKLLIVNENEDHFWVDYSQWRTIKEFVLYRAGLSGAGAVRTIARLLLFPLTVLYLLLYAGMIHTRRRVRMLLERS
jgi:hypothetical protein